MGTYAAAATIVRLKSKPEWIFLPFYAFAQMKVEPSAYIDDLVQEAIFQEATFRVRKTDKGLHLLWVKGKYEKPTTRIRVRAKKASVKKTLKIRHRQLPVVYPPEAYGSIFYEDLRPVHVPSLKDRAYAKGEEIGVKLLVDTVVTENGVMISWRPR